MSHHNQSIEPFVILMSFFGLFVLMGVTVIVTGAARRKEAMTPYDLISAKGEELLGLSISVASAMLCSVLMFSMSSSPLVVEQTPANSFLLEALTWLAVIVLFGFGGLGFFQLVTCRTTLRHSTRRHPTII